MSERKRLEFISSVTIMNTPMKKQKFIVDEMIYPGLHILSGDPKIGKSWMMMDMCLSIAKGEKFLGRRTEQGHVVYMALEDTFVSLQSRMYELTDEPSDNLQYLLLSNSIRNGLEEDLQECKKLFSDLKLVVIDTLQKVRETVDMKYGTDYKELSILKSIADQLEIAIVLVHHTRKCSDSDPFNMISGSAGLSGCVDGSMVLVETKRGSRTAKLYCVGRDIENAEINLQFDSDLKKWIVTDDPVAPKSKDNIFLAAVYLFIKVKIYFEGSATELVEQLKFVSDKEFHSNRVTRELVQNGYTLKKYGINFQYKRVHGGRKIILHYNHERDSSDSKNGSGVTVTKQLVKVL